MSEEVVPEPVTPPAKGKVNPQIGSAMIGAVATVFAAVLGIAKCNASDPVTPIVKSPFERVQALYQEGADLFVRKNGRLAEVKLTEAIVEAEKSKVQAPDAYGLLGVLLDSRSRLDRSNSLDQESWSHLQRAIDNGCEIPLVKGVLGNKLLSNPQSSADIIQAERLFQSCVEKTPNNARSWEGLGESQRLLRKFGLAEGNLRKAIELNPDLSQAWYELGKLLAEDHQETQAIECLEKAIEISDRLRERSYIDDILNDPLFNTLLINHPEFEMKIKPPEPPYSSTSGGSGL